MVKIFRFVNNELNCRENTKNPMTKLSWDLRFQWQRGWDSNPRGLLTLPHFECGTFDHSDTSPCSREQKYYSTRWPDL